MTAKQLTPVVIGDAHARETKLRALLIQIGVLDAGGKRQEGFRLIFLGDALSLGYGIEELAFYQWLLSILTQEDQMIIGNHELPALSWNRDEDFIGWEDRDQAAANLVAANAQRYQVAAHVGPWLLTHAGVAIKFQKADDKLWLREGAAYVASALNEMWQPYVQRGQQWVAQYAEILEAYRFHPSERWATLRMKALRDGHAIPLMPTNPLFDGSESIFWYRFGRLRAGYALQHLPQIVGHTAEYGPQLWRSGNLWCIDTPFDETQLRTYKGAQSKQAAYARLSPDEKGGVAALVFAQGEGNSPTLYHVL